MFVAGCRSGWTQQSVSCSHLALAWLARRAGTLELPRQAFSLLLTGSGDVSSRISAPACERWPGRVVYSTTGLSHDLQMRVVLGCGGVAADRPGSSVSHGPRRYEKPPPLLRGTGSVRSELLLLRARGELHLSVCDEYSFAHVLTPDSCLSNLGERRVE